MTKIEETYKKFPAVVRDEIITELEKAGIVEQRRLEIILPVLGNAIEVSKPLDSASGEYNITLIDSRDGKVLVRESDEKKYSIADFIAAFNWESQYADGRPTITRAEALSPSGEDLEEIAKGKLRVLPHPKEKPEKGSIAASTLAARHKSSPSTEDIASGKIPVDMNK